MMLPAACEPITAISAVVQARSRSAPICFGDITVYAPPYIFRVATEPAEADHDVLGEEGLHLEELAPVEDTGDDLSHVIRLVRQLRHDGLQLDVGSLDVVGGRHERRSLRVR